MNEYRTKALEALNKAKALKEQHGSSMPADVYEQFQAHMKDYSDNVKAFNEAKEREESFSQLDDALETFAPASGLPQADPDKDKPRFSKETHAQLLRDYCRYGAEGIPQNYRNMLMKDVSTAELQAAGVPKEQWAHLGTVDSLGGFLVPEDFMAEFLKDLPGFAIMRRLASRKTTTRSSATFMTLVGSGNNQYTSGVSGSWRGEGWVVGGNNIPTQNQPRFGRERVQVHIWAPDAIELTMELMEDSAINIESEIRNLLVETKAMDEDSAFFLGSGVGQPMGIVTEAINGSFTNSQSQAANGQTYDGLVDMWSKLPAQYRGRATWVMNSITLGLLALLKDTAGNPIFPTNDIPTVLFKRPLEITEFMPDGNVDGNQAIIFGDFSKYGIVDRMDMRVIRLNERFAPNAGLLAVARTGGQVLRTQPFVSQTVGA